MTDPSPPDPRGLARDAAAASALLGVDLGTSSAKAAVFDASGGLLAASSAPYPVRSDRPGWAETDPEDWWSAVVSAVGAAVGQSGAQIAAMGLCGQMHGVVLCDGAGRALRPALLWPDSRAADELEAYRRLTEAQRLRLANPLSPGMAGPMLAWLRRHEPDRCEQARWALQPKDWLRLRLTGRAGAEPSDASATLLYDVPADRWADDIARAVGADPGLLAPLGASAEHVGALTPAAAERLGLPEGLPVTAGAADVAAGILGAGLSRPGELQLTLGTGGQFVTLRDSPEAVADAGTHLYRTAQPRGWYAMAATLNVGLALDWVRRVLGATWEELYATAGPPRSEAPIFLPHLVGERTPHLDPDLRAAWSGLALGHERADLLRSALEGVALSLREALEALAIPGDVSVRLTGGGSVHPGWRQMLADLLDRPIAAVEAAGASARGAALLAGIAVEQLTFTDAGSALAPVARVVAEPDPTAAEHLASRFARFRILAATAARQAGADRERASGGSAR